MKAQTFKKIAAGVSASAVMLLGIALPAQAAATSMNVTRTPSVASTGTSGVSETFVLSSLDSTNIECISVNWGQNPDGSTGIPGFNATGSTLALSGGVTLAAGGTGTTNAISRSFAATMPGTPVTMTIAGVTNGSTPNTTYYARVATFSDAGCTAVNEVNFAVAAFTYTNDTTVSVDVAPTMTFTVAPSGTECSLQPAPGGAHNFENSGDPSLVSLGRINSSTVGHAAQLLSANTNAANGTTVYIRGDHAGDAPGNYNMRNVSNPSVNPFVDTTTAPAVGQSRFSYTVSNTHSGLNTTWKALNNSNAEVAWSNTAGFTNQCIGFSASAAADVPAGTYQATVHYTAVPAF